MVDVRVRDDDLFQLELLLVQDGEDSLNLVAGIDDQSSRVLSSPMTEQLQPRRPTGKISWIKACN